MSSSGTIALGEIWSMLDHCAPGYSKKERKHNWLVMYRGISYPSLPLGPHGARKNPEIQIGHVKNLARQFRILDCARTQLEQLRY